MVCSIHSFIYMAGAVLELGLRRFAQGVMLELHGQNVLLAFRGRRIAVGVEAGNELINGQRPQAWKARTCSSVKSLVVTIILR